MADSPRYHEPRSLSFFFPAYNEEGNLTPMVDAALRVLPALVQEHEIIIVDDGSGDGTQAEGKRLAEIHPTVMYVRHQVNRGYGEAIRTGLQNSTLEAVAYTDGDQQFDLAELSRLLDQFADADVVAGYRIKRADPVHRRFIAWTYNRVLRAAFGIKVRDVDCAFKLIRRETIDAVHPDSGGAFFSAEFLLRAHNQGYRVVEVGVTHLPRTVGKPKGATPRVILRTFAEMYRLKRKLGGRLVRRGT
ncbi:MAG TPA: glycosyltransferase family 2 protein [Candidatus Dormibacteraeota bacterium]|nr:glycosyltransferase family 2 protein [Candidatus Dormibacteraeota bacterium]